MAFQRRIVAAALLVGMGAGAAACTSTPEAPSAAPPPLALPAVEPTTAPTAADPVGTPLRIDYGNDPAQYGWLRLPPLPPSSSAQQQPIVVLVHGGFWAEPWDYTLMDPMADALLERGVATWNIEFRRLNGRGGWPGTFDDVSAAIVHLRTIARDHPIDLDRVVIAGHSSGGHLALWAAGETGAHAATLRPTRAIGISAVTDLALFSASRSLLGGAPDEVPERWAFATPLLEPGLVELVHGDADDIVPVASVANAVEAGVQVTELTGVDHFEVIEPGPALDAVVDVIVVAVEATSQ